MYPKDRQRQERGENRGGPQEGAVTGNASEGFGGEETLAKTWAQTGEFYDARTKGTEPASPIL